MIAQGAVGIAGVTVLDDGTLRVDAEAVESGLAEGVPIDGSLQAPEHGGLLRFLERIVGRVGSSSRMALSSIRVKPYTALVGTPLDVERCWMAW